MSDTAPTTLEEALAAIETWKGHARKWEDRAKENAAAKKELDDLKAASLSESDKAQKAIDDLTKRLDEADKRASEAAQASLRLRIATAHGISTEPGEDGAPSQADLLLTGADEATLTAQAVAISGGAASPSPSAPKPNPAQGRTPQGGTPSPKDAAIDALGSLFN